MQSPMVSHFIVVKRVLRYLKGTLSVGISYSKSGLQIKAFSDANWITIIFLGLLRNKTLFHVPQLKQNIEGCQKLLLSLTGFNNYLVSCIVYSCNFSSLL